MGLFHNDRPRPHHYQFAHRQLLAAARRLAATLPELARSGRLDTALTKTWEAAGDHLPLAGRLSPAGRGASLQDADGRHIALVTMPHPEHGAEAYFVAIVVAGKHLADYFVLEHGWTTDDKPRTVLCKWTDQGHVNLEDGPPAQSSSFLSAVQGHLRPSQQ